MKNVFSIIQSGNAIVFISLLFFLSAAGLVSCSSLSKKSFNPAVSTNGEAGHRDPASVNRSLAPSNQMAKGQTASMSAGDLKKTPISHVVLGVKGRAVCVASTVNKPHLVPSFARTAQIGRRPAWIDLPECNEQQLHLIQNKAQFARLHGDKMQVAWVAPTVQGVAQGIRFMITTCSLGVGGAAAAHLARDPHNLNLPALGTAVGANGCGSFYDDKV